MCVRVQQQQRKSITKRKALREAENVQQAAAAVDEQPESNDKNDNKLPVRATATAKTTTTKKSSGAIIKQLYRYLLSALINQNDKRTNYIFFSLFLLCLCVRVCVCVRAYISRVCLRVCVTTPTKVGRVARVNLGRSSNCIPFDFQLNYKQQQQQSLLTHTNNKDVAANEAAALLPVRPAPHAVGHDQ